MKWLTTILLIYGLGYSQMPQHYETHNAGIVTEVKIVGAGDVISLWVMTDKGRDYVVKAFNEIPRIYVGDSLFEYWVNYQKTGVGTTSGLVIYDVEKTR